MRLSEAETLRAAGHLIGQDCLTEDFDIEVEIETYHICVIKRSPHNEIPIPNDSSVLVQWSNQSLPTQPEQIAWTTSCTLDDLIGIGDSEESKSESLTLSGPFTGQEFLKAVGACLDELNSRLRRLSRKGERMIVAYETPLGQLEVEEYLVAWLRNRTVASWRKAELVLIQSLLSTNSL